MEGKSLAQQGAALAASLVAVIMMAAAPVRADTSSGLPGAIYGFGASARGLAMGSAQTAAVDDVASVYYNPSGLARMTGRELTLTHAQLAEGAAYDYAGYGQRYGERPLGMGLEVIRLGVGGVSGRDELDRPTGGDVSYSETAIGVAGACRGVLHPDVSLGVKGKALHRKLDGASANTLFAGDVGVQAGPWRKEKVMLGAVAQNVGSFKQGDTEDSLRPLVRLGATVGAVGPLSLSVDYSSEGEVRAGTELSAGPFALRCGLGGLGYGFGGGMRWKGRYSVDYAVHPTVGGAFHRLSVGVRW